jgi:hypothetical protein
MVREHDATVVSVPRELVEAVDQLVGREQRERFVAEALAGHLADRQRLEIAKRAAGSLADIDIRGWETPEAATAWVDAMRRDDERLSIKHSRA